MNTVRKNITLSHTAYEIIRAHAKKNGKSFSEFLRDTALQVIEQNEKLTLLEHMNAHCSYISKEEQAEIEMLKIDFECLQGKELTLDEIL